MGRRDLYNTKERIKLYFERLSLWCSSEKSREILQELHAELVLENLSPIRILIFLERSSQIFRYLKKDFDKITEKDSKKLILLCKEKGNSDGTISLFIQALRKLSKVCPNLKFAHEIKYKIKKSQFNKHWLSYTEVKQMINAAENIRDKAFVSSLYETCMRPGDIMSIRRTDINFDDHGALLFPDGKTGHYPARIIESEQYLALYLELHCKHLKDEDYIWVSLAGKDKGKPIGYDSMSRHIRRLAKKAGIEKPICLYSFRHGSNSHYLKLGYPAVVVNRMSGRKAHSDEIEKYTHLSNEDIDNIILEKKGLKKQVIEEDKPKQCHRCSKINPTEFRFCGKCGAALDMKTAIESMDAAKKKDVFMRKLMEDSEIKLLMAQKIKELEINVDKI